MPLQDNPDAGAVDDADLQAYLAAMQRALSGTSSLAGTTSPDAVPTDESGLRTSAGLGTGGIAPTPTPDEGAMRTSAGLGAGGAAPYNGPQIFDPNGIPVTPSPTGVSSPVTGGSISQPSTVSAPQSSFASSTISRPAPAAPSAPSTPAASAPTSGPSGAVTPIVAGSAGTGNIGPGAGAGAGTGSSGAGVGSIGSVTNQIGALMQSLTAPGTPVDAQAAFLARSKDVLSMLDQQEASLRSDYEKQGTTLDPATQFAINKLRDTLSENIKNVQEQLNSRGLYSSGIELELENRLQKGSASDQAQLIAQHLSKLQDQLNTGLSQIRQNRTSTMSQFGMGAASAQNSSDENTRRLAYDREQAALQAMLNLRNQYSGEQQNAARLAFEQQNAEANRQQQLDLASLNNAAALTRAAAATRGTSTGGTGGGTGTGTFSGQNVTGYPVVPGERNPFGGTTPTPSVNPAITNAAISAVDNASDRTSALASLQAHAADMTAAGVDLQAVMDAIDAKFPPAVGPNDFPLDNTTAPSRGVGGSI